MKIYKRKPKLTSPLTHMLVAHIVAITTPQPRHDPGKWKRNVTNQFKHNKPQAIKARMSADNLLARLRSQ